MGGPDSAFSLEPDELRALVRGAKASFEALGTGASARAEVEKPNMVFRRSIYVVRDIGAGEFIHQRERSHYSARLRFSAT